MGSYTFTIILGLFKECEHNLYSLLLAKIVKIPPTSKHLTVKYLNKFYHTSQSICADCNFEHFFLKLIF